MTERATAVWDLPEDLLGFLWAIDDKPGRQPETLGVPEVRRLVAEWCGDPRAAAMPEDLFIGLAALGIFAYGDAIPTADINMPAETIDAAGSLALADVTVNLSVLCATCRHLRVGLACTAFPDGIPYAIQSGFADHRKPYPNDNGVRWQSAPKAGE